MKDKVLNIIKSYKYTIILMIIVFVFSLIFKRSIIGLNLAKDIFASLLSTSIIYVFISIFIYIKMRFLVAFMLAVFLTIDILFFYLFESSLNYGIIASIFETDMYEAISMSDGILIIGLLLLALLFFLLIKATHEMKSAKKIPIAWSLLYLFMSVIVLPFAAEMRAYKQTPPEIYERLKVSSHLYFSSVIHNRYPFLIGDLFYVLAYLEEVRMFKTHMDREKFLPLGVEYVEGCNSPSKVILVIGESAQRGHMSLYGYEHKTTPFMDSLFTQSDKLMFFDSIISPASFTRDAIRITLSYSTPQYKQAFWDNKNIIDLANGAGYRTIWIANQPKFGVEDSYTGHVSASANENNYNNAIYDLEYKRDDLELLPVFKSSLKKGERQFIALHLAGSHHSYSDKFDGIDTQALGSKGKTVEYDKSIHHTDRVIKKLYDVMMEEQEDFLILYYSDHGEVVNVGHGVIGKYKDQYKIPLVLISDTLTSERFAPYVNRYYNDETKRLNSSNLIYFFGEMMGYSVSDSLVQAAKKNTEYTYQPDGSIKRYSEIKD